MKKVIRLTESDLMRIVKRVISEESAGAKWYFDKGQSIKISIKNPQSYIIVKITGLTENEPGNITEDFVVLNSTYPKMPKGFKGHFETYYDYTYTLYNNSGSNIQSGKLSEIKKV